MLSRNSDECQYVPKLIPKLTTRQELLSISTLAYSQPKFMTMSIRLLLKMPLLCLLTLCLLTSPAISFGYVWCVSADGHAMLETAFSCDCCEGSLVPRATDCPNVTLTGNTDCCGPCLAVPAAPCWSSPPTRNTEAPVSIPAAHAPVVVVTQLSLADRFLTNHLVIDPPPRTSDSLLQLRTIVLRN